MKKLLTLLLSASAAVLAAGNFTLDPDGTVLLHGKKLVADEKVNVLSKVYNISDVAPEITKHNVKGKSVVNRLGKDEKLLPFRRETALSADGKQVELTFQARVDAFRVQIGETPQKYGYSFKTDVRDFDGGKYYVIVGRSHLAQVKKGDFDLKKPFAPGKIRFLALEKGDRKLVIDANVEGVTNYSSPTWNVVLRKGFLDIDYTGVSRYQGETGMGKLVFYEGTAADYDKYHARRKYSYQTDFNTDRAFSFGAAKKGKVYAAADDKLFNAKRKSGWVKDPEAEKVVIAPSGALYSAIKGSKPAVFKVTDLKSGIYFVTLRTSAGSKDTGKFSVKVNNEELFKDMNVPAGKLLTATVPMWIENGTAEIAFTGSWQVSTILFQLLQTSFEDIKFRRGYWVSDDYEPCLMYKNAHYKKHPVMQRDVHLCDLAPHRSVVPANYKLNMKREVLLPPATEKNQWRFNELLTSSGANKSKFIDFKTDELKNRELDYIAKNDGKVIILSGMLSRHTFPAHMERADQYVADFTRLAHQRGMKVFDHVDMPLLWNADSGFRVMCETTTQLQRNVMTGAVNRMYCINNPMRNRVFFDWAKNLVKKSDIDGMMVDEVTFFTGNFCGCRFCRTKFTADTGLTLSMDETARMEPMIFKAWNQWRNKAIGDWWVEFRREISTIKEEFSTLLYTTHGGWSTRHAGSLFEGARSVDILGTEIMSRNVIAAQRPVNAFRKMKTALGAHYHTPIYGLVYPGTGCWNIAYFGWALNYMNRQTTWDKAQAKPAGASDYKNYKMRLDLGGTYGLADTAVVYSLPTIMFPAGMRTINEILGVSEVLTDMNIMHDFIINADLTDPAALKRFKTIYAANARCLSDAELKGLRDFAANGGTVYASFHCGTADELGFGRKEWAFKDIFGVSPRLIKGDGIAVRRTKGIKSGKKEAFSKIPATGFARMFGKCNKGVAIKYFVQDGRHNIPAVLVAKFGKGKIIYSNVAWGQSVAEYECGPDKPYKWQPDAELMKITRNVLSLAIPENMFVKFTSMPENVIASITGSNDKKYGKLAVVNLLNSGNACREVGTMIKSQMPADRGKVDGNIVFTMQVPADNVEKVYAVTPDFAGEKAIAYKAAGKNSIEVTVPGSMLKTFLEVRVKLKK